MPSLPSVSLPLSTDPPSDQPPIAILLHEYLDTLAVEVDRMWYSTFHGPRMSWNWAAFFFYLNRYLVLFSHVPVMLEFFWGTSNPNKLPVRSSTCHFPIFPNFQFSDSHFFASPKADQSTNLQMSALFKSLLPLTNACPVAVPSENTINTWLSSSRLSFLVCCAFN